MRTEAPIRTVPATFDVRTVGVSFAPGYPENLHRLDAMVKDADFWNGEPISAVLVREPDNEFDANAIAVHVPGLGEDAAIGHIPREVARKLAPIIDGGTQHHVAVAGVVIHPDHAERPGVWISVKAVS
jgi:hypothetical protein